MPAAVIGEKDTVPAAITHPHERGIFQINDIQHNGRDGKEGASNIHEHGEAQLRETHTSSATAPHTYICQSVIAALTRHDEGQSPARMVIIPVTMNCGEIKETRKYKMDKQLKYTTRLRRPNSKFNQKILFLRQGQDHFICIAHL